MIFDKDELKELIKGKKEHIKDLTDDIKFHKSRIEEIKKSRLIVTKELFIREKDLRQLKGAEVQDGKNK